MRKITFLFLIIGLLALSAFAQAKPDYSGTWTLDKEKSKLDERMAASIESQTLTVAQTETELKVTLATKRNAPPAGGGQGGGRPGGGGGQGGGRGMGGFGGGDSTTTYSLNGKETTFNRETPMGSVPVKLKAELEKNGKLKLSSSSTMNTQMGEMTVFSSENWELSADGKTLKVKRIQSAMNREMTSESVYTKQ